MCMFGLASNKLTIKKHMFIHNRNNDFYERNNKKTLANRKSWPSTRNHFMRTITIGRKEHYMT